MHVWRMVGVVKINCLYYHHLNAEVVLFHLTFPKPMLRGRIHRYQCHCKSPRPEEIEKKKQNINIHSIKDSVRLLKQNLIRICDFLPQHHNQHQVHHQHYWHCHHLLNQEY